MNISFSINDDILLSLKENAEEFTQNLRFISALTLYRKNRLSLGKAAELAGYNKLDFIDKLRLEKEAIFDFNETEMNEIVADYQHLRESELMTVLAESKADIAVGRYVEESAVEHLVRLESME